MREPNVGFLARHDLYNRIKLESARVLGLAAGVVPVCGGILGQTGCLIAFASADTQKGGTGEPGITPFLSCTAFCYKRSSGG